MLAIPSSLFEPSDEPTFTVVGSSIHASFFAVGASTSAVTFSASGNVVTVSGPGITFNLSFDTAAMAASASLRAGIEQAAGILAALITDKITVNLNIDISGTGGGAAAGPDNGLYESYSLVRNDLVGNATAGDTTFNALPTDASIQGQTTVAVWNAQLKLWGLLSANDATTDDGGATFAADIDPNLIVGVALHELTHAMGRIPYGTAPDVFDLFRYTSSGVRLFQGGATAPAAYFSLDGGITKLADYGQTSDASDFLNSGIQGPNDPFNEFYSASTAQALSAIDLRQLDALGFHLASANQPPVVTAVSADVAASAGQSFALSSLFSASDADNDTLTYMIYDATTNPSSGHFVVNGTAVAAGTPYWLTQAQLAQTVFVAGAAGTSDDIRMIAYDGQAYSGGGVWTKEMVSVSGTNSPPQMTLPNGANVAATPNSSLAVGSLFSATDSDGDALSYLIYDGTTAAGHGHWVVNGTVVPQATAFWVTQAQLAQTTYVVGTTGVSDDVRMIAYDGQSYSGGGVWSKVSVLADSPPQITLPSGASVTATSGQSFAAGSLFSASDADGDTLSYLVYDGTTTAGHGHWVVNGTVVPQATPFWITQAQLAQTTFVAGSAGLSDDVRIIAFDGHSYSGNGVWSKVQVNVGSGTAPVATEQVTANGKSDGFLNDFFHADAAASPLAELLSSGLQPGGFPSVVHDADAMLKALHLDFHLLT